MRGPRYNKEELRANRCPMSMPPKSALKLVNLLEKWRTTNKLYNEEMLVLTKEGKQRTVLVNAGFRDIPWIEAM